MTWPTWILLGFLGFPMPGLWPFIFRSFPEVPVGTVHLEFNFLQISKADAMDRMNSTDGPAFHLP